MPKLGAKAFDWKKLRPGGGTYEGSALVIFTDEDKSCEPCKELNKLTKTKAFKQQHASWWSSNTLRVGKVYCDQHPDICSRFGVTGDEDTATGTPYIAWFKGGNEIEGGYDGERTLEGFQSWVASKQEAKEL